MRFSTVLSSALLGISAVYCQSSANNSGPIFTNVTIYTPPSNYTIPRTLYARTLLLNQNCETDNVLLATWENYSPEPPYFPIYQSTDLGQSWSELSRVEDQVNGWGLRYQPFLYELPQQIGNFSAGTILLAGSSIPEDLSITQIELYASTDKGKTWKFVSHIARGGRAYPVNGETPVWEPFLMVWKDQLVCYYSDQRDPADDGQKLVHQTTRDLLTWDDPVDDVAYGNSTWRPGMPIIAEMPFGQYIMTYEFFGAEEKAFAAYYRITTDPLNFNASVGHVIQSTDGFVPAGSPYVVWLNTGGPLGTIAVSTGDTTELYLNHNLGAPGAWTRVPTPAGVSYTRSLRVMPDGHDVLIVGGGVLNGTNNSVIATSVDLTPVAPGLASCLR